MHRLFSTLIALTTLAVWVFITSPSYAAAVHQSRTSDRVSNAQIAACALSATTIDGKPIADAHKLQPGDIIVLCGTPRKVLAGDNPSKMTRGMLTEQRRTVMTNPAVRQSPQPTLVPRANPVQASATAPETEIASLREDNAGYRVVTQILISIIVLMGIVLVIYVRWTRALKKEERRLINVIGGIQSEKQELLQRISTLVGEQGALKARLAASEEAKQALERETVRQRDTNEKMTQKLSSAERIRKGLLTELSRLLALLERNAVRHVIRIRFSTLFAPEALSAREREEAILITGIRNEDGKRIPLCIMPDGTEGDYEEAPTMLKKLMQPGSLTALRERGLRIVYDAFNGEQRKEKRRTFAEVLQEALEDPLPSPAEVLEIIAEKLRAPGQSLNAGRS